MWTLTPPYSREVAALRREVGAGGSMADSSAWDTPVARELRGKIKILEKEGRKREELLQVLRLAGGLR